MSLVPAPQSNVTDGSPLAARVFLEHYEQFVSSVADSKSLADGFRLRDIIREETRQQVHSRSQARSSQWLSKQLFLATHEELINNPGKFGDMLDVLKRDESLQSLCKQLELAAGAVLVPSFQALISELRETCGWVQLGLCLKFPFKTLLNLEDVSAELSKIHLVSEYLRKCKELTWSAIVAALCDMNRKHLAVRISAKYGVKYIVGDSSEKQAIQREHLEKENAVTIQSLAEEMEDMDKQLLEVEEDIGQSQKELLLLQKHVDELQEGNITMRRCNSELLVEVLRAQIKLSEARGSSIITQDTSPTVDSAVVTRVKELKDSLQKVQGQLETIRQDSSVSRKAVNSITSQVEAITGNLHHLTQKKQELSKAMWHCERSMNTYLLQNEEEEMTPQCLSAVDLHTKYVKMELNEYEMKLEDLETRRGSLLNAIDRLEREMEEVEATKETSLTEVQPSVDNIYNSAIQKHGNDNRVLYLELSILQKRTQLALLGLESGVYESELYPLVQELSELHSKNPGIHEKPRSALDSVGNGDINDSLEAEEFQLLRIQEEATLDWVKQRPSLVHSSQNLQANEESQYMTMEQYLPHTPPPLLLGQQKDSKKFLSLRRFSPSKRKTKMTKKKEKSMPLPPQLTPQSHRKYHTISYREEMPPAVSSSAKTNDAVEKQPWYADVSRDIAECRLKHCNQDGAFLVRPSSTSKGTFVLSLLYGGRITHARIEKVLSGKYTVGDEDEADFDSVMDLVIHYQTVPFVVCGSTTLQHIC